MTHVGQELALRAASAFGHDTELGRLLELTPNGKKLFTDSRSLLADSPAQHQTPGEVPWRVDTMPSPKMVIA